MMKQEDKISKTKLVPFDIEKAKNGAKVVTRNGLPAKIVDYPIKNEECPILGLVLFDGSREFPLVFAKTGNQYKDSEGCYDLFIEEEVEEDDSDYDPYKATVESIADMVERYSELQTLEELKHFYNNVKVKCREAVEYDNTWNKKQDEKPADNKPKFKVGDVMRLWTEVKDDITGGLPVVVSIDDSNYNCNNETIAIKDQDDYEYPPMNRFVLPDRWYTCIKSWATVNMKIGDWFEEGHYYLSSDILKYKGLLEDDEDFKDYFHPWNISDAKDGDVLMKGGVIFIFNKMLGEWIYCHSSILYEDDSSLNLSNRGLFRKDEVYPAIKQRRDFLFQKMKEAGYEWDEKKKELKKIENEEKKELKKVEPKFQKGDWVVFKQDGNAHQIIRVVENATNHTYGYDTADDHYFNDTEESVRRWTIQEAKNGDVLRSTGLHNDCIFIFNGLDNWKFDAEGDRAVATGYCCLFITADKMEFGIQGPDCIEVNTIKPATKEQRELLFQAIKEEGYEWDPDKKELKKIENEKNEERSARMTNRELALWLRSCPEELREYKYLPENTIFYAFSYREDDADKPVEDFFAIRRNGGEWMEPLIEL